MYPEEWLEQELKEMKNKTIESERVFFYYVLELIKVDDIWRIVEHCFNSELLPVNGDYPLVIKKQLPSETDEYMKRLYDFSCRIKGYNQIKDLEKVISSTHIRRNIIDYVDRKKGLDLHKNRATSTN